MGTLGSRIRDARERNSLQQSELAQAIGVKAGVITNWERDVNKPSADKIALIAQALNITLSHLLDYDPDAQGLPPDERELLTDYRVLTSDGKAHVRQTAKMLRAQSPEPFTVQLPFYHESAAAGFGNYLVDGGYETREYDVSVVPPRADFVIGLSGQSMEPKYPDGCNVFVQALPEIDSGAVGIFVLNGGGYCKKLIVDRDRHEVRLRSLNPKYEDIVIEEDEPLVTIGRVLGVVPE
ncbi:putative repressor protein - phage associated [Clostridia bacterium]|nr:putative repressor protein - phage associated [Clostridia bacterium]